MKKATLIAVIAAFALGGLAGAGSLLAFGYVKDRAIQNSRPVWTETPWPFLLDQWGKGKAFRCGAAHCGTEVNLYVRAKIGFCNCTTGVADDEELERLSDFDLMGSRIAPMGSGRPIAVAHMKGRSRSYQIAGPARGGRSGLSVAFNDRCDAIVATVVTQHERPETIEPGVVAFLNGDTVLRWAEATLGL